jgi:hypothetical protein
MSILEELDMESEDFRWESLALCHGIVGPRKPNGDADDPLYDSYEASADAARAVDEMCERCPVRRNCLITGVERKEQGVWGGFYLMAGKPDKNRNAHKTLEQWQDLRDLIIGA